MLIVFLLFYYLGWGGQVCVRMSGGYDVILSFPAFVGVLLSDFRSRD